MSAKTILSRGTNGSDPGVQTASPRRTFQGTITGTGTVSGSIAVEVSNDGTDWLNLGTIALSGPNRVTDGFASEAPWPHVRGTVSGLTGTNAWATLTMNGAQ